MGYVFCYICNKRVPYAFIKNHYASEKHKTYLKLIKVILSRMSEPTNSPFCNKQTKPDVYFCKSCVALVNLTDKDKHESSIDHKYSLELDEFVKSFRVLYSFDGKSEPSLSGVENIAQNEPNANSSTKGLTQKLDDPSNTDLNQSNSNNDQNNENYQNERDKEQKRSEMKSSNDLKNYLQRLIRNNRLKISVTVIAENKLEIVTSEGRVQILESNFHGIKAVGETQYLCLLCNEMILSSQIEKHINKNLHLERVCVPYENAHCIRQIDETWGHCGICNSQIEGSKIHIQSNEEHERLFKASIIAATVQGPLTNKKDVPSNTRNDNNEKIESVDPNANNNQKISAISEVATMSGVDNCINDNEKSTKATTGVNKVSKSSIGVRVPEEKTDFCEICETAIPKIYMYLHVNTKIHQINEKIKNMQIHYLMETGNNGEVMCKICNVSIDNNPSIIENHLETETHVIKYSLLLSRNNIIDLKNCRFFCNVCSCELYKMDEITHIHDEAHVDKVNKAGISLNIANQTFSNIYCTVCNVVIPNISRYISEHKQDSNHIERIAMQENSEWETDIQATDDDVFEIDHHMTLEINQLHCIICNSKVLITKRAMEDHINGTNHILKYNNILNENYLQKVNEQFYCKICSVNINNKYELVHCRSVEHLEKFNLLEKVNSESQNTKSNDLMPESDNLTPEPNNVTPEYNNLIPESHNVTPELDNITDSYNRALLCSEIQNPGQNHENNQICTFQYPDDSYSLTTVEYHETVITDYLYSEHDMSPPNYPFYSTSYNTYPPTSLSYMFSSPSTSYAYPSTSTGYYHPYPGSGGQLTTYSDPQNQTSTSWATPYYYYASPSYVLPNYTEYSIIACYKCNGAATFCPQCHWNRSFYRYE